MVFIVLAIVSLFSAFVIYTTLVNALEDRAVDYMQKSTEVRLENMIADGNRSLELLKSVCIVTNVSNEPFIREDWYWVSAASCDTSKISDLAYSDDPDDIGFNIANEMLHILIITVDNYRETLSDMHPNEKMLFWEKAYDIVGLFFVVRGAGESWATSSSAYRFCRYDLNESTDCMHALFDAEAAVADSLIEEIDFGPEFIANCEAMFESDPAIMRSYSFLGKTGVCPRTSMVLKKVFDKTIRDTPVDDNSRFNSISHFFFISKLGTYKDEETRINLISNMIADVIDPEYAEHFRNLGTRIENK